MAALWSSQYVDAEHKDLQATSMALGKSAGIISLSGRRCVAILDANNPSVIINKFPRQSKWEVGTSEWSPLVSNYLALGCNQRVEVLSLRESSLELKESLKAHVRAISGLNWSPFDPNLLTTASIDGHIYIWDMRDFRKPSLILNAIAGVTQVKWNPCLQDVMATSHEGNVKIWDMKKGTSPVFHMSAHLAIIHGLDWNPHIQSELCTSCHDGTVKFWDVFSDNNKPIRIFSVSYVLRARYTPFRDGVLTVAVPQLRRTDNNLMLWNFNNLCLPVHTFVGSSDAVLEFDWRPKDNKDFDLVTWSKDQSLRIWTVDQHLQQLCSAGTERGHDHELFLTDPTLSDEPLSQSSSQLEDATPLVSSPQVQPHTLKQEFSLVNLNIPNLTIDELDHVKRVCTVTVICGKMRVGLRLLFPPGYPNNDAPTFEFTKGTNVDTTIYNKLLKVLKVVSSQQVRRNRLCLEPCLRQLVSSLEQYVAEESKDSDSSAFTSIDPMRPKFPTYCSYSDSSVPFPRTSGARFCGADLLVCFQRPNHLHKINAPTEVTPRSLSALNAYLASHVIPILPSPTSRHLSSTSPSGFGFGYSMTQSPTGDSSVSISSFYQQDRKPKARSKNRGDQENHHLHSNSTLSSCGAVLVYSITKIMPINYELAKKYQLGEGDLPSLCTRNATLALEVDRWDLYQVWSLAAQLLNPIVQVNCESEGSQRPWAQYPLGRSLIESQIDYYLKMYDIQTVAMLCCVFGPKTEEYQRAKKSVCEMSSNGPGGSPYHTVVPTDISLESWSVIGNLRRNRSNSWSDALDETSRLFDIDSRDEEKELMENNKKLLDPKKNFLYEQYKKVYSEILYRWNLLEQRALVLKHSNNVPEKYRGIEFMIECQHCHSNTTGPQCAKCKKYCFSCAICHIAVKGLSSMCMECGHGGHTYHMIQWFQDNDDCPSGCGCRCIEIN